MGIYKGSQKGCFQRIHCFIRNTYLNMITVKSFILIAGLLFVIANFYGCFHYSEYYDLGGGFKYGYFDSKGFLNVYYNNQGIVYHGVCHSVEWNDEFILIHYYPDNGKPDIYDDKECLITKKKYSIDSLQMESEGVIKDVDSINAILKTVVLTNRKSIEYP